MQKGWWVQRAERSARNILSVVMSADKFCQILRSNIWKPRHSLWSCFCLSYFPGHWSSQRVISLRELRKQVQVFLRRNVRNGKQPCRRFGRVINNPAWAALVSTGSAGEETENAVAQLQAARRPWRRERNQASQFPV